MAYAPKYSPQQGSQPPPPNTGRAPPPPIPTRPTPAHLREPLEVHVPSPQLAPGHGHLRSPSLQPAPGHGHGHGHNHDHVRHPPPQPAPVSPPHAIHYGNGYQVFSAYQATTAVPEPRIEPDVSLPHQNSLLCASWIAFFVHAVMIIWEIGVIIDLKNVFIGAQGLWASIVVMLMAGVMRRFARERRKEIHKLMLGAAIVGLVFVLAGLVISILEVYYVEHVWVMAKSVNQGITDADIQAEMDILNYHVLGVKLLDACNYIIEDETFHIGTLYSCVQEKHSAVMGKNVYAIVLFVYDIVMISGIFWVLINEDGASYAAEEDVGPAKEVYTVSRLVPDETVYQHGECGSHGYEDEIPVEYTQITFPEKSSLKRFDNIGYEADGLDKIDNTSPPPSPLPSSYATAV